MNLAPFFTAIKTRLEADTGTGGLFKSGAALVSGCYSVLAPPLADDYPYLLIDHEGDDVLDGFGLNFIQRAFRVHVFAEVANGLAPVDAILNRIYGDGDRSPTYGLHRHSLTLASGGWTGSVVEYRDTIWNSDVDIYHVIQRYVTRFSKAAS